MGKASVEVDTSQLRNLISQAKGQLETLGNTLDQIDNEAKNLPVTVVPDEGEEPPA